MLTVILITYCWPVYHSQLLQQLNFCNAPSSRWRRQWLKVFFFLRVYSILTSVMTSSYAWANTKHIHERRCLNSSTIPAQGPIPHAKLAARGYRIIASSVFRQGQPDSGEGCIVLQNGPTCSLLAKFQSSLAVREFRAAGDRHWTRPRMGVCKPLGGVWVLARNNTVLVANALKLQ